MGCFDEIAAILIGGPNKHPALWGITAGIWLGIIILFAIIRGEMRERQK
jgi:hypothetical protein